MTISNPLPPVATRLSKPVAHGVKSFFAPTSRFTSQPTRLKTAAVPRISKSLISNPFPIARAAAGLGCIASSLGSPASSARLSHERGELSKLQYRNRAPSLAMKQASVPFIARSLAESASPPLVRPSLPRMELSKVRHSLISKTSKSPGAERLASTPTHRTPSPAAPRRPTLAHEQSSPLLGLSSYPSEDSSVDYEDLLSVKLPYDILVETPPFTPLISPHSPTPTSMAAVDDLLRDNITLDSCLSSPESTLSDDFCYSPSGMSSIVWRYSSTPVEKKPVLTLEIPGAVSLRDEITRGIVSAVDHMLDDDLLLFPPSAISPSGHAIPMHVPERIRLPTIQHLRLPYPSRSDSLSGSRHPSIGNASHKAPCMHKDVWAAYWTLHRSGINAEPDVDGYFVTSPV